MSARGEVSRRRERSRSRSKERGRRVEHGSRRRSRSRSPVAHTSKPKHKSSSKERKHKKEKKSKKKKQQSSTSSSSSSSSDSDEEELKLLQRLEAERLRLKEERRKQKEEMKAKETPEEKRARRLREKQAKERKRRERMGWDNEYQCYTDQDNPFGDSALTDTFLWGKKLAKEGVAAASAGQLEALTRRKQLENKAELEKVKARRVEREAERAAREAEASAAARAREATQYSAWARQEDAFHLHQAKLRSQIRIRDGRAKPVDLLASYVAGEADAGAAVDALEVHEPYRYLDGLRAPDLDDLLADIQVYRELDAPEHAAYWRDLETIARDELAKLRRAQEADGAPRDAVHRAVADDVARVFRGKSGAALAALEAQVRARLAAPRSGLDVGYWETLLSQLQAHMARARLRDRHRANLRRKLRLLRREQGVAAGPEPAEPEPGPAPAEPPASPEAASPGRERECDEDEAEYAAGRYSPAPLSPRALEPGTLLTEPAEDEQRLRYLRARLAGATAPAPVAAPAPGGDEALQAACPGAADEPQFSVEAPLPEAACLWADKYRPRKPRYFNRVHTGFEWNKYNQTHYDMDNPPPKIVQGYKFNIFYPDLIDKNATPEFTLKPCSENPEFAVLVFHAGPPYEDIAFKIVNREWEYSYKRGFRCHFHNNIFQLWFHFKRYRYRR